MMKSDNLNVGVIGCGQIASDHLGAIVDYYSGTKICLCDKSSSSIARWQHAPGVVGVFSDAAEMFRKCELDIVHILTPPLSHKNLALLSLNNGCHVFIEKPMSLSVRDTEEVYSLAEMSKKKVCVGHSLLYMPCLRSALDEIRSGDVGRVISVYSYFGHSEKGPTIPYRGVSHWAYATPGGPLINLVSHPASVVAELVGELDEVNVFSTARNFMPHSYKDLTSICIRGRDIVGNIVISMAHGNASRYANIECEKACFHVDFARQILVKSNARMKFGPLSKAISGIRIGSTFVLGTCGVFVRVLCKKMKSNPGTRYLVREFYKAVIEDRESPVSKDNSMSVAMITERLIQSQQ